MDYLVSTLTAWAIPIAFLILVATFFAALSTWARNYHTVPRNQVAVVSGRRHKLKGQDAALGYRVITGGGFFKWPVLERVDYLFLNVMSFAVDVVNVPCKDGALVTVKAIANVKIQSDDASLGLAIERFLGRRPEDIQAVAKENLESNLRAIVGTLTIEQLIQDRQTLQANVMREAHGDLNKLGLGVDLLNIQDVRDERGYIDSLGKTRTEQVKKDAAIGTAEAQRDALIKSSIADQAGKEARAKADQAISHANREKDVIIAENAAKSQAANARVALVTQIAVQQEQSQLNVATVNAEKALTTAQTELMGLELERKEAELRATVIVTAEKAAEAKVIAAQADQDAAVRTGEAQRIAKEKEGLGDQALQTAQAVGRKALASAVQAEREAEAAGQRAALLAVADGKRAELMAVAEGKRAFLLAEAEGASKKADAFRQLDEAGRFLLILDASPMAIRAVGDAVREAISPVASSIGKGLEAIDSVKIVDFGGVRNGESPMQAFANYPIQTITKLVEQAHAAGLMPAIAAMAERAGFTWPMDTTSTTRPNGKPEEPTVASGDH